MKLKFFSNQEIAKILSEMARFYEMQDAASSLLVYLWFGNDIIAIE